MSIAKSRLSTFSERSVASAVKRKAETRLPVRIIKFMVALREKIFICLVVTLELSKTKPIKQLSSDWLRFLQAP